MHERIRPQMAEEAEAVFLEAMQKGWAAGYGCDNRTEFEKGPWRVVDQWLVGSEGHSAGWTAQYLHDLPFWQMHYQGRYDKQAIPFVKHALLMNYTNRVFYAGRGPTRIEKRCDIGLLRYEMLPDNDARMGLPYSGYDDFSGIEKVWLIQDDPAMSRKFMNPLGFHRVQGMRLQYV